MQKAFGSRLAALAADKAANAITANAISYPDESGFEKNRIRFTSSELLKSSRMKRTAKWKFRFHFGGRL